MLSDAFRRTAVLFSLIAVLATPCASAASSGAGGGRPVHAESVSPGLLDMLLSFFGLAGSRTPYLKEGCKIDPDGLCYAKAGCKLDPNGLCHTGSAQPPHAKEGCKLDPNGLCYTGLAQPRQTGSGCKIDPNGLCLP